MKSLFYIILTSFLLLVAAASEPSTELRRSRELKSTKGPKTTKAPKAPKETKAPKAPKSTKAPCVNCPTNCQDFPKELVEPSLEDITISDGKIWVWEGNPLCTGTAYTDVTSCNQVGKAYGVCTNLSEADDAACDSVDTWEISDYGTLVSRGVTGVGTASVVVGGTGCFEGAGGTVLSASYIYDDSADDDDYNYYDCRATDSRCAQKPTPYYGGKKGGNYGYGGKKGGYYYEGKGSSASYYGGKKGGYYPPQSSEWMKYNLSNVQLA